MEKKYAVNIRDMMQDTLLAQILLTPVVPNKLVVKTESVVDGDALFLECNEERASAIVDVIRLKYQRHEIRCYESKTGRGEWKRI